MMGPYDTEIAWPSNPQDINLGHLVITLAQGEVERVPELPQQVVNGLNHGRIDGVLADTWARYFNNASLNPLVEDYWMSRSFRCPLSAMTTIVEGVSTCAKTNQLVNLRLAIYHTIKSTLDCEEAGNKLLKIKLEAGQEMELCVVLIECCSQERKYRHYYGLLGQRFCLVNRIYQENFDICFMNQYSLIVNQGLETNKLLNMARFFAHLFSMDALNWHVLACIRVTEDTTSSSQVFIMILFQELSKHLGIRELNKRLSDPLMQDYFDGILPTDNLENMRFAIQFFTSLGLDGLTGNLREYLNNYKPLMIMNHCNNDSDFGTPGRSSSSNNIDSQSFYTESKRNVSDSNLETPQKRRRLESWM